jgi:hypothetical protein
MVASPLIVPSFRMRGSWWALRTLVRLRIEGDTTVRHLKLAALFFLFLNGLAISAAQAQSRVALVIGNTAYQNAPPVRTARADARMIAETLRAAGYDVTELTDLPAENIGLAIRDFLDKAAAGGPQTIAFFYYAGHAAQSGGENFLIPVDAQIGGEADIENEAFRLSDMMEELAQMQAAARIVVIDGAHDHRLGRGGQNPVSPGLAIMTAPTGALVALSAAPGAIAPDTQEENGLYATALVTLMREPELDVEQIFKSARIEVNKITEGAQTPWMASALEVEISLFDRQTADPAQAQPAPPRAASVYVAPRRAQPVQRQSFEGIPEEEAYRLAVEQDTLQSYQWFLELYPRSPYAVQVWEIVGTRREAILWRRALAQNTARAYWNYLRRYPNGIYANEARYQLESLSQPVDPPPNYVVSPEPLPPEYYDEGINVPELVPEGEPPPPPVWGFGAPYQPFYVAPPPPRVIRPWRWRYVRPPPPPFVVVRPPRLVARPPRIDHRPPPRWVRPPRPAVGPGVGRPGARPGVVRPTRPPRAGVSLPPRSAAPRPGVVRPGAGRPGVRLPPSGTPAPGVAPRPGVGTPPRGPGVGTGPGGRPPRPGAGVPSQPQPPRSGRIAPSQPPRPGVQPRQQPQRPQRPQAQPPRPQPPPQRPQTQPRPQPPRPAVQPRPQPPRPQAQPQRPQTQPRQQPPRPQAQPPRPQAQPPRPQAQPPRPQPARPTPPPQRPAPPVVRQAPPPPRPAVQPQRPAPQPQCPPGTRNVGGRCQR